MTLKDNSFNIFSNNTTSQQCEVVLLIIRRKANARFIKKRLFVDMDGTLAVFHLDKLKTLLNKGYFENLEPIDTVVQAVKTIKHKHPELEVNVLSAVLSDSKYALNEKNIWLDKYLPEIKQENRIFPPCGTDKKEYVPGGVSKNDFLLDDYTKNLLEWNHKGTGIKLLNGINHTRETWKYDRIRFNKMPSDIANNILEVMNGGHVTDAIPQQYNRSNQYEQSNLFQFLKIEVGRGRCKRWLKKIK